MVSADPGWLDLMLREASIEDLEAHAHDVRASGVPAAVVERDFHLAVLLRSRLDQRRQRANELAALNAIAGRLAAMHELTPLLKEITEQARTLLGVDLAYLGLFRDGHMEIEVASGVLTPQLLGLRVALTTGIAGAVWRRREPVSTRDYSTDPTFHHDRAADAAVSAEGMGGLLGVPLVGVDRVIGALFAGDRQERGFSAEDTQLLSALAAHASVAIENAENSATVRRSAERLSVTNEQLEERTRELEQLLEWDKTLNQVVLRGGDVDDLVREIARVAGVPAVFVRAEAAPHAQVAGLDEDDVRRLVEAAEGSAGHVQVETGARVLRARAVVAGGRRLGLLVLMAVTGRGDAGSALLERAATALAMALTAERSAREAAARAKDSLVVGLLTGTIGPAESRRQASLAGLDPSVGYCVMVAQPVEGHHAIRATVEALTWPAGTVVAEHGLGTVVLAPSADPEEVVGLWPADRRDATVAVAGPAPSVDQLQASYLEAQQTLEVMVSVGRAGTAGTAGGLGLYRILLGTAGAKQIARLVEETLGPLVREERHKSVPLLLTLESYLRHQQRHAVAARELNVHVNTLYQRLATIDRVMGVDWREPDRALDLQMVLRLRSSARLLGKG